MSDIENLVIGGWIISRSSGTISSNGRTVKLEPRVMDVLIFLAAHPGQVVSREDILQGVWGETFVEEGVISQAIHSLRKALGDDARRQRFIQTVPKRGYRLVAGVPESLPNLGSQPSVDKITPLPESRRYYTAAAITLSIVLILSITIWGLKRNISSSSFFRTPQEQTGTQIEDRRLVVLPFQNIGNPTNAYFADGLTEEITKDLASQPSLQVISRTSAVKYSNTNKSLSEIGKELEARYVLEGTVRWSTGPEGLPRVRITPQLIRVADDVHVWAQSYSREITDIFAVQAEISRQVMEALGIHLLPTDRREQLPPTENLSAYEAYVRGLNLKNQPFYSEEHLRKAALLFERAVEQDPDFVAAWAELSQTNSYLYFNTDPTPDRFEKAKKALDRASTLDSKHLGVLLAKAYFSYRCQEDFDSAGQQLYLAAQMYPNSAEILQALGFVLRRQGHLPEAIDTLRRAFSLDPRTTKLVWAIAETQRALRNYEQADLYFSKAIELAPDEAFYWEEKALNRVAWKGDLIEAREILSKASVAKETDLMTAEFQLDLYERRYSQALGRLSAESLKDLNPLDRSRLEALSVVALDRLGDLATARKVAQANLDKLNGLSQKFPHEPILNAWKAVALAQLGQHSRATELAELAVRQSQTDAFSGPIMAEIQAMSDAIMGRRSQALREVTRLIKQPYRGSLSRTDLRFNPVWDSLRQEVSFKSLFE